MSYVEFSELEGKVITEIKGGESQDFLTFICSDGTSYTMYHSQDCCEHVYIESVVGDLDDLIGTPIIHAEENSNEDVTNTPSEPHSDESETWTFYRIGTVKGTVVIRWYGSSNGYYSESVSFEKSSGVN